MLTYPSIDPIAVSLGPFKVHWYGLMYLVSFFLAWVLGRYRANPYQQDWTNEQVADLVFYSALGTLVGGRLGYMLFYNTSELITDPLSLFKIWEGGMSFHGGLLGVFFALLWVARKFKKPALATFDFTAPLVPLGIAAGRVGNFINGELWGRVTDVPWAMVFPHSDGNPRHPSQLYELTLEGLVLFVIVWWYAAKPRPNGTVSGVFLMGYAGVRILIEFFRQPDVQLGYLAFGWLTMGQLLSVPMALIGFYLWWTRRCKPI